MGFQQAQGKIQNGTSCLRSAILVLAENTIFVVFSATHSFADMKECNFKKNAKIYQKHGGCLPECKEVFFCMFFWVFGGRVSFFLCFCACVCKQKKGPKNLLACNGTDTHHTAKEVRPLLLCKEGQSRARDIICMTVW